MAEGANTISSVHDNYGHHYESVIINTHTFFSFYGNYINECA